MKLTDHAPGTMSLVSYKIEQQTLAHELLIILSREQLWSMCLTAEISDATSFRRAFSSVRIEYVSVSDNLRIYTQNILFDAKWNMKTNAPGDLFMQLLSDNSLLSAKFLIAVKPLTFIFIKQTNLHPHINGDRQINSVHSLRLIFDKTTSQFEFARSKIYSAW